MAQYSSVQESSTSQENGWGSEEWGGHTWAGKEMLGPAGLRWTEMSIVSPLWVSWKKFMWRKNGTEHWNPSVKTVVIVLRYSSVSVLSRWVPETQVGGFFSASFRSFKTRLTQRLAPLWTLQTQLGISGEKSNKCLHLCQHLNQHCCQHLCQHSEMDLFIWDVLHAAQLVTVVWYLQKYFRLYLRQQIISIVLRCGS